MLLILSVVERDRNVTGVFDYIDRLLNSLFVFLETRRVLGSGAFRRRSGFLRLAHNIICRYDVSIFGLTATFLVPKGWTCPGQYMLWLLSVPKLRCLCLGGWRRVQTWERGSMEDEDSGLSPSLEADKFA